MSGTGTIPGLKGGSATIKVAIEREPEFVLGLHGQFYVGLISVDDPGAHLNTTAFVLSTALTRVGTNEVFGCRLRRCAEREGDHLQLDLDGVVP